MKLSGKVAMVTGCGGERGLGRGIARRLAADGADLVLTDVAPKGTCVVAAKPADAWGGLSAVAAEIEGLGRRAITGLLDVRSADQIDDVIARALEAFGRLDILVNNAGVVHRGDIENTSVELWNEIFETNLRAPFILCQEAVKHMKERRSGCIINIGSVNAHFGLRKLVAYSASKGGLMILTKNLANYLTRYRIRVNQINPGWVLTEGEHYVESVVEGKGENWLEDALKTRPFGRMLAPEDIAQAALFFATNELITGAVLDYEQTPVGAPPDLESLETRV